MKHSIIKSKEQIAIMRKAGKHLATVMQELSDMIVPGIETMRLEEHFIKYCSDHDLIPACKDYAPFGLPPFPTGLCVSVNEQSVHCFPKDGQKLKEGDVVTIDTVIGFEGLYVDMANTIGVGKISDRRKKLLDTTERAMYEAISKVRDGVKIGVVSRTIYDIVRSQGYDVLREYAGHGIGASMHEYPNIPCYGSYDQGPSLSAGMTVCIEPLVTEGDFRILHAENGWETRTKDNKDFVQFEHTILVTNEGYEILTIQ